MYSSTDFYETMDGKADGRPRCWVVAQSRQAARVWRGLPSACRALLAVGLLNMALTLAYSATGFAAGEEGERVHFSVSTVVAAIGIWLCLIDAVIFENTFEMFGVVLVGVLILLRVLWVLIRHEAPFFLILIWGVILSVTQAAELLFCVLAHRQFGWRVLSHIGFDVRSEGRGAKMRAAVVANAFTAAYRLLLILVMIMTTVTIVASVEGPPSTRAALIVTSAVGFAATIAVVLVCLYAVARATRQAAAAEEAPPAAAGARASRRRLDAGAGEAGPAAPLEAAGAAPRAEDPAPRRRVSLDAAVLAGAEGGKPEREAPARRGDAEAPADPGDARGLAALWARARRHAWWLDLCLVVLLYQPLATIVLCTNDDGYWMLSAKLVMYILASTCILATGLVFLLLHAVLAHRRHVAVSHGRIKLRAARLPASQSAGAARGALLPLQAGAWLGKPSASRPDKLRFFQLSRDASTLRWGWHKYLRLFHVETVAADRAARTLTLRFVADAPLLLRFPDALTLTVWERGLSAAVEVVLAPEDGEAAPPRAPAAADEAVGLWWAVGEGLERALRLRGPLEDEEASRIARHRKRARARGDPRSATLDRLLRSLASGTARRERRGADVDADAGAAGSASGDEPAPLPAPRRAARPALASLRERGSGLRQTLLGWMSGVSSGGEAEDGRKVEPSDLEAGVQGAAAVVVDDDARRQSWPAIASGHEPLPEGPPPAKAAAAGAETALRRQSALQARQASESRDAGVAALYFAAIADCGEFGLVLPSGLSIDGGSGAPVGLPLSEPPPAAEDSWRSAQTPLRDRPSPAREDLSWMLRAGSRNGSLTLTPEASLGLASISVATVAPEELVFGQVLGAGAEARVFAGWRLGLPVAIKVYAREADAEREVRAYLTAGPHANLLTLHGLCRERGALLLVVDYCPRGTLDVLVHSSGGRPWDAARLLRVVRELAAGLAHLHARGVLHRDLKPSNVLVGPGAGVRIADLGCSKCVPAAALAAASAAVARPTPGVLGTVRYAAPELAAERDDERSARDLLALDVWSLGVVLWEMLARRRPFEGLSDLAVQARWAQRPDEAALPPPPAPLIGGADPRAVARVAAELTRLCADCMAFAPERRPTAEQVLRRVERLEAGLGADRAA